MTSHLLEEDRTTNQEPVVAVLGRQGSGKGTQGERLASRLGMTHLSTGDLLRSAVAERSPIGRQVERALVAGELVSEDLMIPVVADRLRSLGGGVVLDGFPRTLYQAEALSAPLGRGIDLAVQFVVSAKVAMQRLLARRLCERCGRTTTTSTSRHDQRCPACGGTVVRRADDTEASIARRLALFNEQTRPILSWFAARGRLVQVDGHPNADTVTERLLAALASRPKVARLLVPAP